MNTALRLRFSAAVLFILAATLCGTVAAASGSGPIPLPPLASIDELAWAPLAGGKLLITTDGNGSFTVLDGEGNASGQDFLPLTRVRDLRVLTDGSIVAGDARTGRVYHVAANGKMLGTGGARGLAKGEFLQLDRVEIDSKGRLYGLDGSELRVLQFSHEGELLGTFQIESGPVVDAKDRLLAVLERPSDGTRQVVAFTAPGKPEVLYQGRAAGGSRWEPVAALSGGEVLLRSIDVLGKTSLQTLGADGKLGAEVKLAEDAVLAGPSRVAAVEPGAKLLYYLAGKPGSYRVERVQLP